MTVPHDQHGRRQASHCRCAFSIHCPFLSCFAERTEVVLPGQNSGDPWLLHREPLRRGLSLTSSRGVPLSSSRGLPLTSSRPPVDRPRLVEQGIPIPTVQRTPPVRRGRRGVRLPPRARGSAFTARPTRNIQANAYWVGGSASGTTFKDERQFY